MRTEEIIEELQQVRSKYQATFDNAEYAHYKLSYRRTLNAIDAAIEHFEKQAADVPA
ncbi:MAG TPA: hypothetical protein VFA57_04460 [Pseudolabrys sp.]|nr:hypothetical protein [Pseudolabrys sp.]